MNVRCDNRANLFVRFEGTNKNQISHAPIVTIFKFGSSGNNNFCIILAKVEEVYLHPFLRRFIRAQMGACMAT